MAAYQYTGYRTLIYFKYLDREAGHTLVADPGGEYEILATESDLPVPPGDGRWAVPPPPAAGPVIFAAPKASPPAKAAATEEKAGE